MTDPTATVLPGAFLNRLQQVVSEPRLPDVLRSFEIPRAAGFRVNTLLAERDDVLTRLQEAGLHPVACPWLSAGFWVPAEEREALLSSSPREARHVYVQNLSSMVPPVVLGSRPGERILDLAAAPGSKTLQMACMMKGEGELAAVELVRSRFFKMRALLDEYGASFVRTYMQDGTRVWQYRPEYFDRVLLDAPCSSEGRFHAAMPASYAYWSLRKIKEMARKQRRLLFSAIHALRPGGVLVYSTCAFAPEENEAVLDWALRKFAGALRAESVEPAVENAVSALKAWQGRRFHEDVGSAIRILPDDRMEGFFVCRIRKVAPTVTDRHARRPRSR